MHRSRTAATAVAATVAAVLAGSAAAAADSPAGGAPAAAVAEPAVRPAATRIVTASMTIPSIGITSLRIVPYKGTTDDAPGTRIQDRGIAATPYGPHGGVGPGQVGNYLVTGHRIAAGGPLNRVPELKVGDRVTVTAAGTVYTYKITGTRVTSFRSEHSLAEQRAAVPGFPGKRPTQAMITVSTCATPEDDAAGNHWRDAEGNPEHRIDKIGVLVDTRQAPGDR
ncbi:class E sortase [Streptomyces sp. NBC_01198]|uniref:class E sortase n=1 Tax=Streptomyces sp. NBC_01198 TaxID=2903769 RepID=UPI002E12E3F9|nr:class E sortase [Streptomyces sp. NBC_01198]